MTNWSDVFMWMIGAVVLFLVGVVIYILVMPPGAHAHEYVLDEDGKKYCPRCEFHPGAVTTKRRDEG